MQKGKLYLIPTTISEGTQEAVITQHIKSIITKMDCYLVENIRTARRYISSLKLGLVIEDLHFELLDKNTQTTELQRILQPLLAGKSVGIISESGCPGIADPGALAVEYAHQKGVQVIPLSGPSSIFMALMASGFSGQSFVFHGYLPIDNKERNQKIKSMESDAIQKKQTQIFMDTPYRNEKLLDDLLKTCNPNTQISIAKDITGAKEFIQTKTARDWKKSKPSLNKVPVVFSVYC